MSDVQILKRLFDDYTKKFLKKILISAFFTLSIQLSLLVFIGEAVRDAFDPRKVI